MTPRTRPWPCPLCGATQTLRMLDAPDHAAPDHAPAYSVVRCAACGLVRTDPAVVPENRVLIYGPGYSPHVCEPQRDPAPSELAARLRRVDFERTVRGRGVADEGLLIKLLARLYGLTAGGRFLRCWFPGEGRRVLDVGCGAGGLAASLAGYGWRACGAEIDPEAAGRAAKLGVETWVGDFADPAAQPPASWAEHKFVLIVFHHSLEHMVDPLVALRRAATLLVPGGVLYVAAPNAAFGLARLFGGAWYPLDLPRHLLFFEPATLRRTLEAAGFEIKRCHRTCSSRSIERSLALCSSRPPGIALRLLAALARRPAALRLACRLAELLGAGDNLHCYAQARVQARSADGRSVYEHKGAYHWRETAPATRTFNAFLAARYALLLTAARRLPATLCLDVGCGDGRLSALLSGAGHSVLGLDLDARGLALARERAPEVVFVRADACRLPLRPDAAQLAVSADLLEHLPQGTALLDELARVLDDRGVLLLSTPNRQPDGPADMRHVREWSAAELRRDLTARFADVRVTVTHPRLWHKLYRLRILGRGLLRVPLNLLALRLGRNPFVREPRDERVGLQLLAQCRGPRGNGMAR